MSRYLKTILFLTLIPIFGVVGFSSAFLTATSVQGDPSSEKARPSNERQINDYFQVRGAPPQGTARRVDSDPEISYRTGLSVAKINNDPSAVDRIKENGLVAELIRNAKHQAPKDVTSITVLLTSNKLGDTVIFEFAFLELMHETFPKAKITVISPFARNLKPSPEAPWLEPVSVPMIPTHKSSEVRALWENPKLFGEIFESYLKSIPQNSIILSNRHVFHDRMEASLIETLSKTISEEQFHTRYGIDAGIPSWSTGRGMEFPNQILEDLWQRLERTIRETKSSLIEYNFSAAQGFIRYLDSQSFHSPPWVPGERFFDLPVVPPDNQYKSVLTASQYLFGKRAFSSWSKDIFPSPEAAPTSRPYFLFNPNAGGEDKLPALRKIVGDLIQLEVDALASQYSGHDIYIVDLEPQFFSVGADHEVQQLRDKWARKRANFQTVYGDRVKFIRDSFEAMVYVERAASVIAHDGGFYHLASIFSEKVVMIATAPVAAREMRLPIGEMYASYFWRKKLPAVFYNWTDPNFNPKGFQDELLRWVLKGEPLRSETSKMVAPTKVPETSTAGTSKIERPPAASCVTHVMGT